MANATQKAHWPSVRSSADLTRSADIQQPYAERASEVGRQIRQEDGVRVSCDAVERLLQFGRSAPAS